MKQRITACIVLLFSFTACAQKEFFRSTQAFNEDDLKSFYSSVAIQGELVLFSANDYNLYAYNKADGSLKWKLYTSYKTSSPAVVSDTLVFATVYSDKQQNTAAINIATGAIIKTLPVGPLQSKPFIKNGILYGTAIYDAGCLFAYDLAKDSILWYRFLAHGVSRQPYYLEKNIVANAEANNWVGVAYDGQLTDTTCKEKADIFVRDIPCVRNFYALSHDRKEMSESFRDKLFEGDGESVRDPVFSSGYSFIFHGEKLAIIGNKLKVKTTIELSSLSDTLQIDTYSEGSILKADDERVWLFHSNHLLVYNHKTKKAERVMDLSAWQPYQLALDDNRLWLISRKDALLYGINL